MAKSNNWIWIIGLIGLAIFLNSKPTQIDQCATTSGICIPPPDNEVQAGVIHKTSLTSCEHSRVYAQTHNYKCIGECKYIDQSIVDCVSSVSSDLDADNVGSYGFFRDLDYTCSAVQSGSSGNREKQEYACMYISTVPPTCTDECSGTGSSICSDSTHYKPCGRDYDSDPCYDYGSPISCGSGYTCTNGYCTGGTITCIDSDGQNFVNKGYVIDTIYNGGAKVYDSCSSPTPSQVYEVICLNNEYDVLVKPCSEVGVGYTCQDGACVAGGSCSYTSFKPCDSCSEYTTAYNQRSTCLTQYNDCKTEMINGGFTISGSSCSGGTTTTSKWEITSFSIDKPNPKEGETVTATLAIKNVDDTKPNYIVEFGIFPKSWSWVNTYQSVMQSVSSFGGCCGLNEYVGSKFITLAKGQTETVTIQAKAPSKSSIDNCNTNLVSAWNPNNQYTALVQVFENCAGAGQVNIKSYATKPITIQCISSTEICNGKDDDCDGQIDETGCGTIGCAIKGDSSPCNSITDTEINVIINNWKTNQGVSDLDVNNAINKWKTGA